MTTTGSSSHRAFDLASLDMAGTTVDEGGTVYEVLEHTVADLSGQPVPAELLLEWKGTSKREAIAGLLTGLGAASDDGAVDKTFDEFRTRLVARYRSDPPTPFPGLLDTFADLRDRGVRIALQTGYSADIAAALLEGLGWRVGSGAGDTVDAIVTSDQVPASRPAPYLIFRTMEATDVRRVDRVLVAGDTPNDLRAGDNAGAGFVVGVLTGSFDRAGLEPHPHTHLLGAVTEITSLV